MREEDQSRWCPVMRKLQDGREVTIRLLEPTDADALGDFYASLPRSTWRFYCPPRLTRQDAEIKALQALSPNFVCLVAEDQAKERIIGYDWYKWENSTYGPSTFGICLRESHRGAGLGQLLMERLLTIGREIGPPTMSLTVQLANPRAVRLYTKMGFRIIREQMRSAVGDFPAEPEYYMEQTLQRPRQR